MNRETNPAQLSELYELDITIWSEKMVELLRQGQFESLDLEHLIDEVADLGRRERDQLISSMRLILHHLLKWHYQSDRRSRSWVKTIQRERVNIQLYLEDTPSLNRILNAEGLAKAYRAARKDASIETDLPLNTFSESCPYSLAQVLEDHFPEVYAAEMTELNHAHKCLNLYDRYVTSTGQAIL